MMFSALVEILIGVNHEVSNNHGLGTTPCQFAKSCEYCTTEVMHVPGIAIFIFHLESAVYAALL